MGAQGSQDLGPAGFGGVKRMEDTGRGLSVTDQKHKGFTPDDPRMENLGGMDAGGIRLDT